MPDIRHSVRRSALCAGAFVALLAVINTESHAQSVGVSVVPTAERIQWHKDLAFEDDYLYGGRLALRFGSFVELQPFYFTRDGYGIDSLRAPDIFGAASAGRGLDLRHYGANVQFNLGDAAVSPFVRAGAGILRLKPDSAERQDRITVSAGGGLRFGIGGLNAEVFAEQMALRMNPRGLFAPDSLNTGSFATLRNLVYGAAVTVPLSTMSDQSAGDGISGTTAPIEPFVGRLRYASEHNLPDLEIAGVRAGIDFTPVFGLRGFYWRGLNDDRDGTIPVTGWGGEGQFNLNTGPGLSPYLIVGAGQIDYGDNFADSLGTGRVDKTAFILGGGGSFRLSDRVRINGAIRDYVMTVDDDLDNLATTGDITHNTMLTAGLTISFGGRSSSSARDRERERDRELRALREELDRERTRDRERMTDREMRDERMIDREMRDVRMTDREMRDERMTDREMRDERIRRDSARVFRDSSVIRMRTPSPDGARGDVQWITIPVPVQGEIILRYGFPSRDSGDTARVRGDTVVVRTSGDDVAARLAEIERRLTARIDAIQRLQVTPQAAESPAVPPAPATPSVDQVDDRSTIPVFQRISQTRRGDLRPYVGFGLHDSEAQLIAGVRADLGPFQPNSGFHFVPELAVGVGSGPMSVLAMANLQYAFGAFGGEDRIKPWATVGAGVFSPTVLGINTAVGSSFALRGEGERPLFLNVELQGINLFSHTRVLIGLSRGR